MHVAAGRLRRSRIYRERQRSHSGRETSRHPRCSGRRTLYDVREGASGGQRVFGPPTRPSSTPNVRREPVVAVLRSVGLATPIRALERISREPSLSTASRGPTYRRRPHCVARSAHPLLSPGWLILVSQLTSQPGAQRLRARVWMWRCGSGVIVPSALRPELRSPVEEGEQRP